ncbi:MAG: ATP-dependent zinc metalloprotease FtsH [Treponemataceae bacterium]
MKNLGNNNKNSKFNLGFIFLIALVLITTGLFFDFNGISKTKNEISYTDFLKYVESGSVSSVVITDGKKITGNLILANDTVQGFVSDIPYSDANLIKSLIEKNVSIIGKTSSGGILPFIFDIIPTVLIIFIFVLIIKNMKSQNMQGMNFGKSKAKKYFPKDNSIKFADVAGQEEAKEELAEVVDFLQNPKKYSEMGAKIPKGVLLVGNPGTGKTLMARAVAGEAGVSFLHISGSDFVEMFVGVGASRVRDLFSEARKSKPCIIFIDEIDAVGRARGAGLGGGHDEREQTLNQMLVEMDGFETESGIIVLAATNRPDVLDPALLRPGRFDRQVTVSLPDIKEREAILAVHAKKIKLDDGVKLEVIARSTSGMTGADLANILNEAAILASRRNIEKVSTLEIEDAKDKILLGTERKSIIMKEDDKLMTSYHEAGHTMMHFFLKNVDRLHKVTIIPRGRALGVTMGLPEEDVYSVSKEKLLDDLVVFYGGYAAEQLIYNTTTTGASNDIQRATQIARKMVCEWGMSADVGAVCYGQEDEPIFMGREIARHKSFSEETAALIDKSVKEILSDAKNKAYNILKQHKDLLDTLAKTLLEKETLTEAQILALPGFDCLEVSKGKFE